MHRARGTGVISRAARDARPYWPHLAGLLAVSLLAAPLALLIPVPLKIAVDSVLGSQPVPGALDAILPSAVTASDTALLVALGLLFVLIALLNQLQEMGSALTPVSGCWRSSARGCLGTCSGCRSLTTTAEG